MSGFRKRITVAGGLLAAGLFVALGVSMSNADEPKLPSREAPPLPRLFSDNGAFNSPDFQQAREQMRRAMEALSKDPNDAAARKLLEEAQQAMMQALTKGFSDFPGAGLPGAARAPDRARLGVRLDRVAPVVADQLSLEPGKGVVVAGVIEGSPADKAGFKVHDVVIEFGGLPVTDPADFVRRVGAVKAGEKVGAVVIRKAKRVELKGIDLPAVQTDALPINPRAADNGRAADSVSVSVSNDEFVIKAIQSGVNFVITGKLGADGATVGKVSIKDGDEAVEAQGIDKVPEKYRPTVEKLLKSVGKPRGKVRD